jgi:hypothetical protein
LPKAYEMMRVPNAQGQRRTTVATAETPVSQQAVQFIAWIKFLTFNLIQDFGAALGSGCATWQVATLVRRFILRPGRLYLQAGRLIVQLDPFCGDDKLRVYIQHLNEQQWRIPWLSGLVLRIEIAEKPEGLAAVPQVLGEKNTCQFGARLPPLGKSVCQHCATYVISVGRSVTRGANSLGTSSCSGPFKDDVAPALRIGTPVVYPTSWMPPSVILAASRSRSASSVER